MAFNPPKKSHNYGFDPSVKHNVSRETMDASGKVGFESKIVEMTSPEFINTPKCSVFSLEALKAAGQSIKRVPTAVLGDVDSVAFQPDLPPEPPKPVDEPNE